MRILRQRRRAPIKSLVDWLRTGYPDEAPGTGHSSLLALNGPIPLTAQQTDQIVAELAEESADAIDIGIAITKTTNRLPTQAQKRSVSRALR